jgi:hypothetical protein
LKPLNPYGLGYNRTSPKRIEISWFLRSLF